MGIFDKIFGGNNEESTKTNSGELEWFNLGSIDDLNAALEFSKEQPILLFKHSTRCSISSSAMDRFKRNWNGSEVNVRAFYLDLLNHKDVSAEIAERLNVEHQSPQMIIVKDGIAVFSATHMNIDFNDVVLHAPSN